MKPRGGDVRRILRRRDAIGIIIGAGIYRAPLSVSSARDDAPFRVAPYPLTPIVFCAACGYLFYSSVSYAASRGAVHVSLMAMAMAIGFIALVAIEAHRHLASDQPDQP